MASRALPDDEPSVRDRRIRALASVSAALCSESTALILEARELSREHCSLIDEARAKYAELIRPSQSTGSGTRT